MICSSCRKEIPDTAEFCPHCEADVDGEPTAAEKAVVQSFLSCMSPKLMSELTSAFEKSSTAEEFANRIMVGDCPVCGSSKTGSCENDPEIEDPCIARCFECRQLWCPDCGEYFKQDQPIDHDCPAWEDVNFDDDDWDDEE